MSNDPDLRQHLTALLDGKAAHLTFEAVLDGWPADARHVAPAGTPHTAWQLLEHMRLAQRDILEFCVNPRYAAPRFPDDYWPPVAAAPDAAAWTETLAQFAHDNAYHLGQLVLLRRLLGQWHSPAFAL